MNATLHIHSSLPQVVTDFYARTNHERIDAGWVRVSSAKRFAHFEQLIDNLIQSSGPAQVVVSHGRGLDGLLVRFNARARHTASGRVIYDLARLAGTAADKKLKQTDSEVVSAAQKMGTTAAATVQLATKLAQLQKKKTISVEIRGCNIGTEPNVMRGYKKAFGARRLTAPNCRMFFVDIIPARPPGGRTMDSLKNGTPSTPRTRRRFFSGKHIDPIIIDIQDIDGHTRVASHAFMDDPTQAHRWAARLNGVMWQGSGNSFILQVLWDDLRTSYHCPRDPQYGNRLVTV
jgi:hypothetical protein